MLLLSLFKKTLKSIMCNQIIFLTFIWEIIINEHLVMGQIYQYFMPSWQIKFVSKYFIFLSSVFYIQNYMVLIYFSMHKNYNLWE